MHNIATAVIVIVAALAVHFLGTIAVVATVSLSGGVILCVGLTYLHNKDVRVVYVPMDDEQDAPARKPANR